jgi:hypothetical protein
MAIQLSQAQTEAGAFIPGAISVGVADGIIVLGLEMDDGETLQVWLRRNEAIEIVTAMIAGISHISGLGRWDITTPAQRPEDGIFTAELWGRNIGHPRTFTVRLGRRPPDHDAAEPSVNLLLGEPTESGSIATICHFDPDQALRLGLALIIRALQGDRT